MNRDEEIRELAREQEAEERAWDEKTGRRSRFHQRPQRFAGRETIPIGAFEQHDGAIGVDLESVKVFQGADEGTGEVPPAGKWTTGRVTTIWKSRDQEVRAVAGAVSSLLEVGATVEQNRAITLVYFANLTLRDAANVLGIANQNVMKMLTRAKARLRKAIELETGETEFGPVREALAQLGHDKLAESMWRDARCGRCGTVLASYLGPNAPDLACHPTCRDRKEIQRGGYTRSRERGSAAAPLSYRILVDEFLDSPAGSKEAAKALDRLIGFATKNGVESPALWHYLSSPYGSEEAREALDAMMGEDQ